MTYSSRGRSLTETMIAAIFGGFLTGFICVLCIGNYYRAKRAMERQRERRMLRQHQKQQQQHGNTNHGRGGGGLAVSSPSEDLLDSPGRSSYVMNVNHLETDHLLPNSNNEARQRRPGGGYAASIEEDLLLNEDHHGGNGNHGHLMSV
ncbi:hypothetical protein ACA910_001646 [Epithemia clementina (nom. ined.)]